MSRWIPLSLGLCLVVVTGAAHGLWNNRWHESHSLEDAAARVRRVPLVLGEWAATEDELDARAVQVADLNSYISRRYENRLTGRAINVLLVCGKPGPISVHTPDVCFGGAGYQVVEGPARYTVPGAGEFWTARVRRQEGVGAVNLRVLWGWSAGGSWSAPANPRLTFGGSPFLYKLYVVRETSAEDPLTETDAAVVFLQELVSELQSVLFTEEPTRGSLSRP